MLLASLTSCSAIIGLDEAAPASGEDAMPTDRPVVRSVKPSADATDVDPAAPIQVELSAPVDAATISTDRVAVRCNGVAVPGSVRGEGSTIIFTPEGRYGLSGAVEITVSAEVRSTSGAALGQAFTSRFRVRNGRWLQTWKDVGATKVGDVALAANARGESALVWSDTGAVVLAARLPVDDAWSAPLKIGNGGASTSVIGLDVAVDNSGRAIACWIEDQSSVNGITGRSVCSLAAANAGWTNRLLAEAKRLTGGKGQKLEFPRVLLDPALGTGFVSWTVTDVTDTATRTIQTVSALGADGPSLEPKPLEEASGSFMTKVATTGTGSHGYVRSRVDGASVFFRNDGSSSRHRAFANPEESKGAFIYDLALAMSGNTAVMVTQYDLAYPIHAYVLDDVFDAAADWSPPKKLTNFGAASFIARSSGPGQVIVVWRESDHGVIGARYQTGEGWRAPEQVVPADAVPSGREYQIDVATDPTGTMMIVYEDQRDGTTLYYAQSPAGAPWSKPQPLPFATPKIATNPRIVTDGYGRFIVVWREGERIRADRFE